MDEKVEDKYYLNDSYMKRLNLETDTETSNTKKLFKVKSKPRIDLTNKCLRKLTPKECWRLMGFTDEQFNSAKQSGVSDTQLYKQAGNSIVVNVLYYIFANLFKIKTDTQNYNSVQNNGTSVIENIYESGGQAGNVMDENGICSCLMGYGAGGGGKAPITLTTNNVVVKVGNIYNSNGQNGNVIDDNGISSTVCAGTGVNGSGIGSNNAPKVLQTLSNYCGCPAQVKQLGGIGKKNFGKCHRQGNRVYEDMISPCLMAEPVGNSGGYSPVFLIDKSPDKKE